MPGQTIIIVFIFLYHCTFTMYLVYGSGQTIYALRHVFLHENLDKCETILQNNGHLEACEVSTIEDKLAVVEAISGYTGLSWLQGLDCQPENMTCAPDTVHSFACLCKNLKISPYRGSSYEWSPCWIQMTSPYLGLYRQLCHTVSGTCISSQFRVGIGYIVVYHDMPPTIFTASSLNYDSKIERARLDVDVDQAACTWSPALNDTDIWIQYDLQKPYTVLGFIMKKKCSPKLHKYITSLTLKASNDEINWTTPVENVTLDYNDKPEVIYWLNRPVTSQYWKFFPLTWTEKSNIPHLKADLVGYLIP